MLTKPITCSGCALHSLGAGYMQPSFASGPNPYKVALIGEALGEDEAEQGKPFVGRAGFRLTRLIEWAGLERRNFDIYNTVWCRPPGNKLEGAPYEFPAIAHCHATNWGRLVQHSRVVVPLGNVPTQATLGRKGILSLRGYVFGPSDRGLIRPDTPLHILPTVHPSFIARGQSKYSAAVINDLQKAVELARSGLPAQPVDYLLDPTPRAALDWAHGELELASRSGRPVRISYDIETPYKGHDEGAVGDDDDPTYVILRIGFSLRAGVALSLPWTGENMPAIRRLLENGYDKVAWNAGFDTPRIHANGVRVGGVIHDGMVAWHVLHSDLPKGLGFVATFTCPWQPEWKSTSSRAPAYYNATDADVEWRSYEWIEQALHRDGLWEVYERDVLRVDPILVYMGEQGMPVDLAIREDRAIKLADLQVGTLAEILTHIPTEARRVSPRDGFKVAPKERTPDMVEIQVQALVKRCAKCGLINPTKPHFRAYKRPTAKRPQNPCAGAGVVEAEETVTRLARLDPWKPSREQLIRYHQVLGRPIPTRRDKKTGEVKAVFDEMVIKRMQTKYKKDPIYSLILDYRGIDKLAGTYVGKVEGVNG